MNVERKTLFNYGEVTVGDYLAQRLDLAEVSHCFTAGGDYVLPLLEELNKHPELTLVPCCTTMNAGYAADGYARSTNRMAVVVVTYR